MGRLEGKVAFITGAAPTALICRNSDRVGRRRLLSEEQINLALLGKAGKFPWWTAQSATP